MSTTTSATSIGLDDLAAAATDERVTAFHVRDVRLPLGAGTLALITHGQRLRPHQADDLRAAGPAQPARGPRRGPGPGRPAASSTAVGVTGKPFIFAVGADLKDVGSLQHRDQALAVARAGHDQLRRLGELGVPSFAFVNGAAMGGGVELALHCTYRTISSGAAAVALPECFLGLVPGWGGTYLLPNLVGVPKALKVIITNPLNQNRMLKGPQAFELGLADAMFEPADFLEESLGWAARVLTGAVEVEPARGGPGARGLGRCRRGRPGPGGRPAARGGPGAVPGSGPDRRRAHGDPRRGVRRRGRGPRRPDLQRGVPQRRLRLRPGPAPGQAPGRRPGRRAGPAGHHGRRRRRRADGLPAGAALRPAARGAGRPDRPRPGPGRRRRGPGARRDRRAARQGPDQPGPGQPAQGPRDRVDHDRGVRRMPTS